MDGFSYHNIFDTKGVEYLAIISFLMLLIPFWLVLNKKSAIRKRFNETLSTLTAKTIRIPEGIFYSRNHTWAFMNKSGIARIGLDDLLLKITGDVSIHPLISPNEHIRKGELIAEIIHKGKSLSIFSPVSGKIVNVNADLQTNSNILTDDPFGDGWIYAIKPSNWIAEIPAFFFSDKATDWFSDELGRYKDFLAAKLSYYSADTPITVLQDGGELCTNSLSELPEAIWSDFQKEFLEPGE